MRALLNGIVTEQPQLSRPFSEAADRRFLEALARREDLIEGDENQLGFRQAEALIQIATDDAARDIRAHQHRRNVIVE